MAKYYNTLEQEMANYPDPKMPVRTESREEYEKWAKEAREKLAELLCLGNMRKCEPDAQKLEEEKLDGYRKEKWIVQTEPGIYAPLYLLIPDGVKPGVKNPVVMCPHGHTGTKDATSGTASFPELENTIVIHDYDYGRQAVRRGYIAVCPDARGHGERREPDLWGDEPSRRLGCSCTWLNRMAIPAGRCLAGLWIWDLMRILDWVLTLDIADKDHVACIGLSGGGLQTLYFSAIDQRIGFAAVSGYFYGFKRSLLELLNCSCNYVPHMWEYFDVGEIGALIAPRSMVIETGDMDHLNGKTGLDNVIPYVNQVKAVYSLYGREDDFRHDIFHGPHKWNGKVSLPMLDRYMKS